MNILFVVDQFGVGGAPWMVVHLSNYLVKNNNIYVFSTNTEHVDNDFVNNFDTKVTMLISYFVAEIIYIIGVEKIGKPSRKFSTKY